MKRLFGRLNRLVWVLFLVSSLGCGESPKADTPGGPHIDLQIASLGLSGVGDVVWDVAVDNGAGQPVWRRRLTSSAFGDGRGSVTWVGPCDASTGADLNTVRVWVVGLFDAPVSNAGAFNAGTTDGVGALSGVALPFVNPTLSGPLTRTVRCEPNADAPLRFDVTLLRPANQGFFDLAVSFEDLFCSAKLDCLAGDLLHDEDGERGPTVVLGFACTAGPSADQKTRLHLDALRLDCTNDGTADLVIDPSGPPGNQCTAGAVSTCPRVNSSGVDPDSLLFQLGVYRGAEALQSGGVSANKVYWNVALGARPGLSACRLRAHATASSSEGPGLSGTGQLAADLVYPYVEWDVALQSCGEEALSFGDPAAPVRVAYQGLGAAAPSFAHTFDPFAPVVPEDPAPTARFSALAVGGYTACGKDTQDGRWSCWGADWYGQTSGGQNRTADTIAFGWIHACNWSQVDGQLACWGFSAFGENTPPPGVAFDLVALGQHHSCGLRRSDGTAQCWGQGSYGKTTPPAGVVFSALTAGWNHNCGLRASDGQAVCWGTNGRGQSTPPAGIAFMAIAAGDEHTCAIRVSDGGLACWGAGNRGQLDVPDGGGFTALAAGQHHTCALRGADGMIACWGEAWERQVSAPEGVAFDAVGAGVVHSCGLRRDNGEVVCWGSDQFSLVSGAPSDAAFVSVSAGVEQACALTPAGEARCWGYQSGYEPGPLPGPFSSISARGYEETCAVRVDGELACWSGNSGQGVAADAPQGNFTRVSVGDGGEACAIETNGAVVCWGQAQSSGPLTPPDGAFTEVAVGQGYACGIQSGSGSVACWGDENLGPPPNGTFTEVSAFNRLVCGLRDDGSVACWGDDAGANAIATTPSGVYTAVSVGSYFVCALEGDGELECWGYDDNGQVSRTPAGTFTAVAAGNGFACAVRSEDSTVTCWGSRVYNPR